jgi:hypothetical protein
VRAARFVHEADGFAFVHDAFVHEAFVQEADGFAFVHDAVGFAFVQDAFVQDAAEATTGAVRARAPAARRAAGKVLMREVFIARTESTARRTCQTPQGDESVPRRGDFARAARSASPEWR